jgi:EAL domain-containing protein (putative c-di-GMP-specific phosphodiesterase class I)/GGDEF domain-containing protein
MDQYILSHLDQALEEGWVQVYYQPVIRTLTRELCGMEALARWVDPELGLLPPSIFIRPLEEAELIHRLDLKILDLVCENYQRLVEKGEPVIPVSFNLSRHDFEACDIVSLVNACVNSHDMPHSMLHVEITESLLGHDPHYMHAQVKRLHDMGYEVWMDDFGSEYSSLNILKDFDFDELKIDMKFLSDFSVRSRKIITSVVHMAKAIEIQTLAEGVETEEQFRFLRTIGCEKTQGYYFGKPLPYDESVANVEAKGIPIEHLEKRKYHSRIGKVNFMDATLFTRDNTLKKSDDAMNDQVPLAIVEMERGRASYLLANDEYIAQYRSIQLHSVDDDPNAPLEVRIPFYSHFYQLADRASKSDRVENLDFAMNGYLCNAKVRLISSWDGGYAVLCTFANMSADSNVLRQKKLDDALRMLYSVYDRVDLIHVASDRIENLYVSNRACRLDPALSMTENFDRLEHEDIHPEDRERYHIFIDMNTVLQRMAIQRTNFISDKFRVRNMQGNFDWVVQVLVPTFGDTELEVLSYFRSASVEKDLGRADVESSTCDDGSGVTEAVLWNALIEHAPVGMFWKDKNRRFLGVNQTFLDYYNIRSLNDIIGKTDEEMGWHVNPTPYLTDEQRVIANGEVSVNIPGHCLRNGINRNILATKMPLYRDYEIVGLLGYFVDVTDLDRAHSEEAGHYSLDTVTGLLDARGLQQGISRYTTSFLLNQIDYAMIGVEVPEVEKLTSLYGQSWHNRLLCRIGEEIRAEVGVTGIIGRPGDNLFTVVVQYEILEDVIFLSSRLKSVVEAISLVDHVAFRLHPIVRYITSADEPDSEQMMLLLRQALAEARKTE